MDRRVGQARRGRRSTVSTKKSDRKVEWIANETAAKYGVSVARTTGRATEVYGAVPDPVRARPPKPFGA
jgi:hypothetical protein